MEQHREERIGLGLVIGLAVFVLVALASFYFQPVGTSDTVRDRIAYTNR